MMSPWSLMDMSKFATISTTDELIRVGDVQKVIFVPYSPDVLTKLLEIIPDKTGREKNFSQRRFAAECSKAAAELGLEQSAKVSQKSISNYCQGVYRPDSDTLNVMGKVLGVFLVPGLERQADAGQILEYIKGLYSEYRPGN